MRGIGRFSYGAGSRSIGDGPLPGGACVSFERVVPDVTERATHRVVVGLVGDVPFTDSAAKPLVHQDGRSTTLA